MSVLYQNLTLEGLARARFKSVQQLADMLKWSYSKTYRIIRGKQTPDANEIRDLSIVLGISSPEDVVSLFSLL